MKPSTALPLLIAVLLSLSLFPARGQIVVADADGGDDGHVNKYTLAGRAIKAPLVTTRTDLQSVTVSGNDLYTADFYEGTIGEYNVDTGAAINASLIPGSQGTYGVAVANNYIYVSNYYAGTVTAYQQATPTVAAWVISGLGNGGTGDIAVSGNNLFVIHSPSGNDSDCEISEYNALTGASEFPELVTGLYDTFGLALSGDKLFVASYGGGTIGEYTTSGGIVNAALVTDVPDGADGLAVVGDTIYASDLGNVETYSVSTGESTGPITGLVQADSVAVVPRPLFFQNGTSLGSLLVNKNFVASTWQGTGGISTGWQERAVGDINGDGIPDIIFQNGTLLGALTLDSAGHAVSWIGIGSMNAGWQLCGAGDLTGNGNLDLIFQNATQLAFLEVNSSGVPLSWHGIGSMGAGWQLRAVADLNADGQSDLLFQNGTSIGALQVGTDGLPVAWIGMGTITAGWTLAYAADVDGDGQPDLLFQNGTAIGALTVNTSFQPMAWYSVGAVGSGWVLPGD